MPLEGEQNKMNFSIKNYGEYNELKVEGDNFSAETGLMDTKECVAMAVELIEAANDLLLDSEYESQVVEVLAEVLEALE